MDVSNIPDKELKINGHKDTYWPWEKSGCIQWEFQQRENKKNSELKNSITYM